MQTVGFFASPFGTIRIVEQEGKLVSVSFAPDVLKDLEGDSTPLICETKRQLKEYFEGSRTVFDLPTHTQGTEFQEKVWACVKAIPYGETITYGDIAQSIERPKAARAVGAAVRMNPLWVIVPCHRVVGKERSVGGYAGGIWRKEALLEIEGIHLR